MIDRSALRIAALRDAGHLYGIKKYQAVFAHDITVACLSLPFALYLRLGNDLFKGSGDVLFYGSLTFAVIAAVTFRTLGMYRGVWRYASMSDLAAVVKSATVAVLLFMLLMFLTNRLSDIPRSVPVIQWFILVVVLGGPRFTYRLLRDRQWRVSLRRPAQGLPVLLVGASDSAALFIRAMSGDADAPYRVVGILDEGSKHLGRSIDGVPVLDTVEHMAGAVDRLRAQGLSACKLIIADQAGARLKGQVLRDLLDRADGLGLTVARLPSLVEFKEAADDGRIELRPVALADLLGRPQAALDRAAIERLIAGRCVLISGAGGSIGGELARQIAVLEPSRLILLDNCEFNLYSIDLELREQCPRLLCHAVLCDIRDGGRVARVFAKHRPELVFHAAALKHVPMVELNPLEGVHTNVIGTRNIADAAHQYGALAMVQVSTDKAVNPTSVMGASKRIAEFYCQALDLAGNGKDAGAVGPSPRFMTVRFGNVLGSSGSVVPLFQRQLAHGGPLTVTHPDIRRYFMTVREAVELVLQASAHGIGNTQERGRIFVLDMGQPVRIVDVARRMIQLAGLCPDLDIEIKFVGLRPGEKLYEELFDDEEERLPAAVDGVMVAAPRPIDLGILRRVLDELAIACQRHDREPLERLITHVLPSYRGVAAVDRPQGYEQRACLETKEAAVFAPNARRVSPA
jgi:FlaA1/EpsC-like NDP-sugar epimerase